MTLSAQRKQKNNIGHFEQGVPTTLVNAPVLMVERLLKHTLDISLEQLLSDRAVAEMYFSHFFDVSVGTKERDEFINYFYQNQPRAVLGYPRTGADNAVFSIVLLDESESEAFIGDQVGTDEKYEFFGAHFRGTYAVYSHSTHPIMTQVLYQVSKAILHANKGALMQQGLLAVSFGGGDLRPEEQFMPENWFSRVLRVEAEYPYSAPSVLRVDPSKIRTLIYAHDVVVDGVRGGVHVKAGGA